MAFKLGALKLSLPGRSDAGQAEPAARAAGATFMSRRLPIVGRWASGQQIVLFGSLLVLALIVDAIFVVKDTRESAFATAYIATVGKVRMLSQRLAKAAQQASQGNREAFKQLRDSRDEFAASMNLLLAGGSAAGTSLPPTSAAARPALDALDAEWKKSEKNSGLVIAEERNLLALGLSVRQINAANPTLQELADEISALSVQSGGSGRQ